LPVTPLLLLLLAANPTPPLSVQQQIQLELNTHIHESQPTCLELGPPATPGGSSFQLGFQIAPTGKVKISERPPADPLLALVFRCVVQQLGEMSVKAKGVTQALPYDWSVNADHATTTGLAWVADDPVKLDREAVLAGPKQTWLRCEHKDASLVHHVATKELSKWLALAVAPAAPASDATDSSPFWKLNALKDNKVTQVARRSELPKFAPALEAATGLKQLCDPVRALGEKLPKLLESKQGTLAACLKHRHNDLWLTLTLNGSGGVSAADASATSGLEEPAIACLAKTAMKWSFPYKGQSGVTISGHLSAAPPGE